jgi:hypothetical protein
MELSGMDYSFSLKEWIDKQSWKFNTFINEIVVMSVGLRSRFFKSLLISVFPYLENYQN